MPLTRKSVEEKPYNMCLNCVHIGQDCDGPNFLAMDMPSLAKWCKLRKDYLRNQDPKWTNAYIAEEGGISKISVDRFIGGNADDIKISTVASILKVLVNGSWGQYPCAMASADPDIIYHDNPVTIAKLQAAEERAKHLLTQIDKLREHEQYLRKENDIKVNVINQLVAEIDRMREGKAK